MTFSSSTDDTRAPSKKHWDLTQIDQAYSYMEPLLLHFMPASEIALKAEKVAAISRLKREMDVVILGHNYMEPALYHTVTDVRGDSLQLAKFGAKAHAKTIVVCGVRFMAETAKILAPNKKVLLPSSNAGCSLASSITAEDVRHLKSMYPGVPVVSYVNTYAEVKAETDICCTSSNAKAVVESLDSDTIIFIPDRFLAQNIARETKKNLFLPEKKADGSLKLTHIVSQEDNSPRQASKQKKNALISWPGVCEVHEKFTAEDISRVKAQYGNSVLVLAHPECKAEVCEAADFSGSTSAMIAFVQASKAQRYLLLTECAMADNIIAENKSKELLRMCSYRCPHMATITLDMTLESLRSKQIEIDLDPVVIKKAATSLRRMTMIG